MNILRLHLWLILVLCAAFATRVLADEPVPKPATFKASIGGFFGSTYRVELQDGTLRYTKTQPGGQKPKTETVTPTPEQWRAFREALDEVKVWKWKKDYINSSVADGTQWALEITYADHTLKTRGSNSYPDDAGEPSAKPDPTKAFARYLQAVEKLLGGKSFQ